MHKNSLNSPILPIKTGRYLVDFDEQRGGGLGHVMASFNSLIKIAKENDLEIAYGYPEKYSKNRIRMRLALLKQFIKQGCRYSHGSTLFEKYDKFLKLNNIEPNACKIWKNAKKNNIPHFFLPTPSKDSSHEKYYAQIKEFIDSKPQNPAIFARPNLGGKSDGNYKETISYISKRYELTRRIYPEQNLFDDNKISVAINIRRGDIVREKQYNHRILPDRYYCNILNKLFDILGHKNISVCIFSDGDGKKYIDENGIFQSWENHPLLKHNVKIKVFCDEKRWLEAFHNMVSSDILITSKSGFSHLSALLNKGAKIIAPMWEPFDGISNHIFGNLDTMDVNKQDLEKLLKKPL